MGTRERMRTHVQNIRNRDPKFLQPHPLVMRLNSKGSARPFERVRPVKAVPDDGVEGHRVLREGLG